MLGYCTPVFKERKCTCAVHLFISRERGGATFLQRKTAFGREHRARTNNPSAQPKSTEPQRMQCNKVACVCSLAHSHTCKSGMSTVGWRNNVSRQVLTASEISIGAKIAAAQLAALPRFSQPWWPEYGNSNFTARKLGSYECCHGGVYRRTYINAASFLWFVAVGGIGCPIPGVTLVPKKRNTHKLISRQLFTVKFLHLQSSEMMEFEVEEPWTLFFELFAKENALLCEASGLLQYILWFTESFVANMHCSFKRVYAKSLKNCTLLFFLLFIVCPSEHSYLLW